MSITGGAFALTDDLNVCRLLNGLWQVSGAHGRIDPTAAILSMIDYHDAGFTTWDLADHYGRARPRTSSGSSGDAWPMNAVRMPWPTSRPLPSGYQAPGR